MNNNLNQSIQVDLGVRKLVTGIVLQGRDDPDSGQWVTKYTVEYSDDGSSWLTVKDDSQQDDVVRIIYKIED